MDVITPQEVDNIIRAGVDFEYFTGIDVSEYITLRDLNKLARQLDKEDGEDIIRSYVNRLKSNISITRQNNESYIKLKDAEKPLKVVAGNEGKELLQNYIKHREVGDEFEWR